MPLEVLVVFSHSCVCKYIRCFNILFVKQIHVYVSCLSIIWCLLCQWKLFASSLPGLEYERERPDDGPDSLAFPAHVAAYAGDLNHLQVTTTASTTATRISKTAATRTERRAETRKTITLAPEFVIVKKNLTPFSRTQLL